MKKSIALAALLVALGTSVFAATAPVKSTTGNNLEENISFAPLKVDNGFALKLDDETAGKSTVIFYDEDHNIIFKDVLSKGGSAEKGYVVSDLAYGDYTVEIISNKQTVTKQMHVYSEDGQNKTFFFQQ